MFQRVRLNETGMTRLNLVAGSMVLTKERHRHQRPDTSNVAPLIRLLADGVLVPVRLPSNLDVLEALLQALISEEANLQDPAQAGVVLSKLLELIATRKVRVVKGGKQ